LPLKSGGSGSSGFSPCCPVSVGRLFFFSVDVGGWRRDCPSTPLRPTLASKEKMTIEAKDARASFENLI